MKPTGHLITFAGLLGLVTGPTFAADADRALLGGQLKNMPLDVVALAERGLQCRSWSTMEITDAVDDHRMQRALALLRCDALAADMAALRVKYAQSPQALRALDTAKDIGP